MKILSLLLLQAAAVGPTPPTPLSNIHMRDIGCVAIIALVADQQRKGIARFDRFDNLSESGATFAANVGQNILIESGQSRDIIAFAIQESAREQLPLLSADRSADLHGRMENCLPLLADQEAEPVRPVTADDYRICGAMIGILAERGDMMIENKALLFENLSWRYKIEKYGKINGGSTFAHADILKEKQVQNSIAKFDDAVIERCVKMGS